MIVSPGFWQPGLSSPGLNGQSDDNSDPSLLAAGAFLKYLKEYISEGILSLICIAICGKILGRELFYF